jgi:hypothetical protein
MIPGGEAPPPKKIFLALVRKNNMNINLYDSLRKIFFAPIRKNNLYDSRGRSPPSEKNFFWRQSERIIYLYDSLRNFFCTSQKE